MSQRTILNNLLDNLQKMEQLPNKISTVRKEIKVNLLGWKEQYENVMYIANHKYEILEEIEKNYASLCKNEELLVKLECGNNYIFYDEVVEELDRFIEGLGFNNYSVIHNEDTNVIEIKFNSQNDNKQ